MPFGLTGTGFEKKTVDDIATERQNDLKTKFGDGILVGPGNEDSGFTNFINTESAREGVTWDELEAFFNSQDPESALDASLDALCAYTGIFRLLAAKTKNDPAVASCVCTGTNGTIITLGSIVSVVGTVTSRFVTLADATIAGGTANVDIEAEVNGSITYPEGIAGTIETPITGWDTFTFATAGAIVLGRELESNEELRIRRTNSFLIAGGSQLDAIINKIDNEVAGVLSSFIIENTSTLTVGGLPPKSYETIVDGGSNQAIGQKIWDTKPGGIETFGDISIVATDQQTNSQTVKFSRPDTIEFFLIINITVNQSFPSDQDKAETDIKDNVKLEAEKLFGIASNIVNHKIEGFVDDTASGVTVIEVLQSRDAGPPTVPTNIQLASKEKPSFLTANMTVNITGP